MGQLRQVEDGTVQSDEGWAVRFLGPELLEYCTDRSACLVNVRYSASARARQIYATESSSDLFPNLGDHLRRAAQLFRGQYVVV
jgi:hypothetical protein